MTPEQMDRLDWQLAEKFGWFEECDDDTQQYMWMRKNPVDGSPDFVMFQKLWSPTRRIEQAFMVAEKIYELFGYQIWLSDEPRHFPQSEAGLQGDWRTSFEGKLNEDFEAVAKTKELAICLAAAEALEIEVEEI